MANWFKVKRKSGGVGGPLEPGEFGLEDGTNQGLWIGATNPDGTTKQVLVNASSFQGIQKLGITDLNECDGVNNWYFCESDSVARTLENNPVEVAFTLHSMWIKNWGYGGLGVKLLQVLRTHNQEWERYAERNADGVPVWEPWVLAGVDGITVGGRNWIIQKTITRGVYLDRFGNVIDEPWSQDWFYTDCIPVTPGEQTICSGYTNLGNTPAACFYTSDKTFLSGIRNNNIDAAAKLTVPPNAAYLRFSARIPDLPTIKLEKGNKATDWTPAPEDVDDKIQTHIDDKTNPHTVTKAQVGLGNVDNTSDMDKPVSTATQAAIDGITVGGRNWIIQKTITRGKFLKSDGGIGTYDPWFYTDYIPVNPGEQTICSGYTNLGNSPAACFYTSDKTFLSGISNNSRAAAAKLTVPPNAAYLRFSAEIKDLPTIKLEKGNKATDWTPAPEDVDDKIQTHIGDKTNPHAVTKTQVGLGNVDNTSDLDKPISTATQAALGKKAPTSHTHSANNITSGTLSVTRGGTGATTLTSGAALIGNGTGGVTTRTITSSEASGSSSLITASGVFAAIRKRVYTTLFTGSTPTSSTPSATLNTENWGFYSMLRVRATVQWAAATPVVFWIPSAQLSESTSNVAMYTLCLANNSSTSIFTINAQKINASTIQFSGATMSITDIVGVR